MNTNKSFKITLITLIVFALISMSFKIEPITKAYEEFLPKSVYEVSYQFYSKGKGKKVFIKSYAPQSNERQKISKIKQTSDNMSFVTKDEEENKRIIWRAKDKSKTKSYKAYASKMKSVFEIFQNAVPETFQGYFVGELLAQLGG